VVGALVEGGAVVPFRFFDHPLFMQQSAQVHVGVRVMGVELQRAPIGVPCLGGCRDLELEPQLVPILGGEILLDPPGGLRGSPGHGRRAAGEV
jgi:hypothetical protein